MSYVYPNFVEFLEEHKGYYVSFEELYKQIDGKQNILDEIKSFVKYENKNNKKFNFIKKEKYVLIIIIMIQKNISNKRIRKKWNFNIL